MIDRITDAEYVLFAKRCTTCMGNGHIPRVTCSNPEGLSGGVSMPGMPCPRCINGFILETMSPRELLRQVAVHVIEEMTTTMRGKWYDLVVSELEKRIKDVELQILGTTAAKRETLERDLTGRANVDRDGYILSAGDRVAFIGPSNTFQGQYVMHGSTGYISHFRQVQASDGKSLPPFVSVNLDLGGRDIRCYSQDLRKIP